MQNKNVPVTKKMQQMYPDIDITTPSFDKTPPEINEYLERYVVGQKEAKMEIANAVFYHYLRLKSKDSSNCKLKKNNILLIGPHGVGKTFLAEKIAELVTVPFIIADASSYSTTGYQGGSVDDTFINLLIDAELNLKKAEKAIIYIDEIDKIRKHTTFSGPDVSGEDVQHELLRPMEATKIPMQIDKKFYELNTRNILFICGGTFDGLEEIIRNRIGRKKIGFTAEPNLSEHELLTNVRTKDLINYGMGKQFLRRLPVRAVLHPLSIDDLRKIFVKPEDSLLKKYQFEFGEIGMEFEVTNGAERLIAKKAYEENLGASGLEKVCEEILLKYKFVLPKAHNVDKVIITPRVVHDPVGELRKLLKRTNNKNLLKYLK